MLYLSSFALYFLDVSFILVKSFFNLMFKQTLLPFVRAVRFDFCRF